MDHLELKKLIALFEKSEVYELEIEKDGERIHLKKEPKGMPFTQVASNDALKQDQLKTETESQNYFVKAPLVGSFYTAASPKAMPYISVGQSVKVGDVLCLIEAMKVMNEIKADRTGIIKQILVNNSDLVEYNQKLIEI